MRPAPAFFALLALSLCSCSERVDAAHRPPGDLWSLDVGEQLTLAVWVSPAVRDQNGTWLRFVNANFALDSSDTPAGATSVPVLLDSRTPVTLADGELAVRISPAPSLSWGEVEHKLDVIRERLPPLRLDVPRK